MAALAVLGAASPVALSACSSSPSASGPAYEVRAASVSGVGTVLVDGQGLTLYLFEPDHQSTPTCTGSCTAAWPPLLLPSGVTTAKAGPGIRASLLGTVPGTDGRLQVTYDRWPLYRWVGDNRPGIATGQGLNSFGGLWYAVSSNGLAVTS